MVESLSLADRNPPGMPLIHNNDDIPDENKSYNYKNLWSN